MVERISPVSETPTTLIDKRLDDLRVANDILRTHTWDRSEAIHRNEREISWLGDLRAFLTSGHAQCSQQWQPIETAPRDGTEILGVFHRRYDEKDPPTVYGPWTVAWDGRKWRSSWDGNSVIEYQDDFGIQYKGPDIDPTHWQPIPTVSISSTILKSEESGA